MRDTSRLHILHVLEATTRAGARSINMIITSSTFPDNGAIPKAYACEGRDISPPLAWNRIPGSARSLLLIVDDPDAPDPGAPRMTWVHWLLYNLPVSVAGLPEAMRSLPAGALEGVNDWQRTGYGGPCPLIGRPRYFHKHSRLTSSCRTSDVRPGRPWSKR